MLDFKDASGKKFLVIDDDGSVNILDKSVAKNIKDNIINSEEYNSEEIKKENNKK